MSTTEENKEAEKALARVEKETGYSPEQQITVIKEGINFFNDLDKRANDLAIEQEKTERHLIDAQLADRQSKRNFKLANKQLDMLEKVLTSHFAERKTQIEGGFRLIDKALEEGKWDTVTQIFGDMSAMVAKSPLAAAIELNDKMKSGKAITLDDF